MAVTSAGAGEPLVLLHGLGATRLIWSDVTAPLSTHRRVIAPDLPGFGESEPAGDGFALEAVADRVARSLAARGVAGPYDLVGHSLGGAVALTLAVRRPALVRRLVLVAPAGLAGPFPLPWAMLGAGAGAEAAFIARCALAPLAELPWGRRLLLAIEVQDGARLTPAQARTVIGASGGTGRISAAMETLAGADLRPLLARSPAPLGLLWGEHDRAVPPSIAQDIIRVRPDARLTVIARAAHVPMIERPDAFAAALLRLLAGLPTESASPRHRGR